MIVQAGIRHPCTWVIIGVKSCLLFLWSPLSIINRFKTESLSFHPGHRDFH